MTNDLTAPVPMRGAQPSRDAPAAHIVPRWWRDVSAAVFWMLLLFVTALWVRHGGFTDLGTDALTAIGRLLGLYASALLLVQVLLMARVPWLEQAWGQDDLARAHRVVGFSSFTLLSAHIVLITLGYAAAQPGRVWGTLVEFTLHYPGMLLAVAGTVALVMVVVTSIRAARRRMRYESWHLLHLYGYLGAGLVLPHQLWTGQDFVDSPVATAFWWGLYATTAAAVLTFRVGLPLWRSLPAPIRVVDVRRHGPGVTTVTVAGAGVHRLRAQAGQFFQWRFLDGTGWTRAHPFSLSAAPDGATLRFSAALVGDGTARLAQLAPGTRVLVEGPYGRMHPGTRQRQKVLLIGAGIGMAPMRALLESLPQQPGDVLVVERVRSGAQSIFADEIGYLAAQRGADYRLIEGRRIPDRDSWLPESAAAWDDAAALLHLCPDVAERDVFVCGSPPWMHAVRRAARRAGTPSSHIHTEYFEL